MQLDTFITERVHRFWKKYAWFNAFMVVVAKYTPIFMVGILATVGLGYPIGVSHLTAIFGVSAALASAILIRILHEPVSRLTARSRPFDTEPFEPLLEHEPGDSFPSNHAAGAFALAVGASSLPFLHWFLICLAFALALSRIYCGLHHTSDVVVGSIGGATVGIFCNSLLHILHYA